MTILIDTNAFYWAVTASPRLAPLARTTLLSGADDLVVSPLMVYELSQKRARGKLAIDIPTHEFVRLGMEQLMAGQLPLTFRHVALSDSIGWHHRDPFDRLLALQALAEEIPIISSDEAFDRYGIRRIW
jgi:PIN domain nuclease of toxin-antitoxin system